MNREYNHFLNTSEVSPPANLNQQVLKEAKHLLEPSVGYVSVKFLAIHILSSIISLLVCPQFGIGPLGGGEGLMGVVMHLGPLICAGFCGTLYFCVTVLCAAFLLRLQEFKVVARTSLWQFSGIAVLSWVIFMLLGDAPLSILYSATWIVVGGLSASLLAKQLSRLQV